MIFTLKVTLLHGWNSPDKWEATLEIDSMSPLDELHFAIQDVLEFDDDHLYEFFIARTAYSRDRRSFDDENGELYDKSIADLFPLPDRKSLYYLFDYGAHWLFKISKARKAPQAPSPDVEYPRLVSESGTRPRQYPCEDE